MGLLEIASATLRGGEKRVEIAAQNAVNADTPGYKAQIAFSEVQTAPPDGGSTLAAPDTTVRYLATQGALYDTGGKLDLAINGDAYLLVRNGEQYSLTRGGQFGIGSDGAIIDAQGRILQLASGGDANTSTYQLEILPDGTMLDNGTPIGAIGLFERPEAGPISGLSAEDIPDTEKEGASELRQEMLERSNVTLSDEMVELMQAQRQVETGAQLIRAYDQLLDRAISTFSRS